jgi:hypothetical protein
MEIPGQNVWDGDDATAPLAQARRAGRLAAFCVVFRLQPAYALPQNSDYALPCRAYPTHLTREKEMASKDELRQTGVSAVVSRRDLLTGRPLLPPWGNKRGACEGRWTKAG